MKETGQLPPQAIDIEKAVLGALTLEPEAIVNVSSILKPEMFYKEENAKVYATIESMNDRDMPIDTLTLMQEIIKRGELESIGGAYYITELTQMVASAGHIELHAETIKEKFIKRQLINIGTQLLQRAYSNAHDSEDTLTWVNTELEKTYLGGNNDSITIEKSAVQVCEELRDIQGKEDHADGFRTDLSTLRQLMPVWENSRLHVVAARPGMGKTAFAIHEALNATEQGKPVLFFSLEMNHKQLTKRIMTRDGLINRETLKSRNVSSLEWSNIDKVVTEVSNHQIIIDDSTFTLTGIKNKCKIEKKKNNIGCIIIDYLQLVEGDKKLVRQEQVSQMSRAFKLLSKELDVPVFLLAQLNRESENRNSDGFMPKMSDLRESGAIEQDADTITFPHRACYYEPDDDRVWLIVAKNRDGETGKAEVRTNETVSKFYVKDELYGQENQESIVIQQQIQDAGFESDNPF